MWRWHVRKPTQYYNREHTATMQSRGFQNDIAKLKKQNWHNELISTPLALEPLQGIPGAGRLLFRGPTPALGGRAVTAERTSKPPKSCGEALLALRHFPKAEQDRQQHQAKQQCAFGRGQTVGQLPRRVTDPIQGVS